VPPGLGLAGLGLAGLAVGPGLWLGVIGGGSGAGGTGITGGLAAAPPLPGGKPWREQAAISANVQLTGWVAAG